MSESTIHTQSTDKTTPNNASPALKQSTSFLNNDGIDQLVPLNRKKSSSLSLTDQWTSALHPLTPANNNSSSSTKLARSRTPSNPPVPAPQLTGIINHPRVASYAFAFDIDGVLIRGPDTIPEAKQALRMLDGDNKYNIKVPYIFVTNGGGRSETARCNELSKRLEVAISKDQIIQGHTPMKELVDLYSTVLVIGGVGNACRDVAKEYGFKKVVTPLDILRWNPAVTPYHKLTEEELSYTEEVDFSKVNIDAILVFADSRNWVVDQQIILDLLLSKNGVMGTTSKTFDEGPGIFFAHSDFVWATNYSQSRYGMGALQVSIAALYREHTGMELKVTRFGKPQRGTFRYATKVLTRWRKDLLEQHVDESKGADANPNNSVFDSDDSDSDDTDDNDEPLTVQKLSQLTLDLPPASTVYFVGDTPESDIRFANSHDTSWYSILVKTGVYKEGTVPKYKPKHVCENVLEAVKFAIEREHQLELQEWKAMSEKK